MEQTPEISVISPVYNSEGNVPELVQRLHEVLGAITPLYEIILVDDFSNDLSADVIAKMREEDDRVKGIFHHQNIGQHPSILHGLMNSSGNVCIVMDCDLQDPPEAITQMFTALGPTDDAVFAFRKKTYNSAYQRYLSKLFYISLSLMSGTRLPGEIANYGIYRRAVISKLLNARYRYFLFPLAVRKYARQSKTVEVEHARRFSGKSAYTIGKAGKLAITAILANSIFGFTFRKRSAQEIVSDNHAI